MSNKSEGSKRAFVPKTIGESLQNITKQFSNKHGKIEYLILSKWPQIVGSFFADHSEPEKINRVPYEENEMGETTYRNFLNVKVSPAAAVEFQHFKDKIIEKINSYFGYKAITDIRLQQNFIPKKKTNIKKKNNPKNIDLNIFNNEINNLKDIDLKKSLEKLGQSINDEEN